MLGFGALGQFALGETGAIRQDLIAIERGGSSRTRRYSDEDHARRVYERGRELERRRAKRRWIQRDYELRREDAARRKRLEELRRARAEAEARRLEQERQRLLAEALLAVADVARQAELVAHIQQIEARLQALYLQTIDDDTIALLLLAA